MLVKLRRVRTKHFSNRFPDVARNNVVGSCVIDHRGFDIKVIELFNAPIEFCDASVNFLRGRELARLNRGRIDSLFRHKVGLAGIRSLSGSNELSPFVHSF